MKIESEKSSEKEKDNFIETMRRLNRYNDEYPIDYDDDDEPEQPLVSLKKENSDYGLKERYQVPDED